MEPSPDKEKPALEVARAVMNARLSARFTQEKVAERMGTTQTAIARLESGHSAPTTRTLDRFARAIGRRLVIEFHENGTLTRKKRD